MVFDPELGGQRPALGMMAMAHQGLVAFAEASDPEVRAFHAEKLRAWYQPGQTPDSQSGLFRAAFDFHGSRLAPTHPAVAALVAELHGA